LGVPRATQQTRYSAIKASIAHSLLYRPARSLSRCVQEGGDAALVPFPRSLTTTFSFAPLASLLDWQDQKPHKSQFTSPGHNGPLIRSNSGSQHTTGFVRSSPGLIHPLSEIIDNGEWTPDPVSVGIAGQLFESNVANNLATSERTISARHHSHA
jgi:hypothetical protein